jgi:hypothetical protein
MNHARARDIQKAIRLVLLHDWDPIGVKDVAEAKDEYDGYVGAVYRLLASGATDDAIVEYLRKVEAEDMGLSPATPAGLHAVAEKLRALDIHLDAGGPAA